MYKDINIKYIFYGFMCVGIYVKLQFYPWIGSYKRISNPMKQEHILDKTQTLTRRRQ
jgi:hypothetical protein